MLFSFRFSKMITVVCLLGSLISQPAFSSWCNNPEQTEIKAHEYAKELFFDFTKLTLESGEGLMTFPGIVQLATGEKLEFAIDKGTCLLRHVVLAPKQKTFQDPQNTPNNKCPLSIARKVAEFSAGKAIHTQQGIVHENTYSEVISRKKAQEYQISWQLGALDFMVGAIGTLGYRAYAVKITDDCQLNYLVYIP